MTLGKILGFLKRSNLSSTIASVGVIFSIWQGILALKSQEEFNSPSLTLEQAFVTENENISAAFKLVIELQNVGKRPAYNAEAIGLRVYDIHTDIDLGDQIAQPTKGPRRIFPTIPYVLTFELGSSPEELRKSYFLFVYRFKASPSGKFEYGEIPLGFAGVSPNGRIGRVAYLSKEDESELFRIFAKQIVKFKNSD